MRYEFVKFDDNQPNKPGKYIVQTVSSFKSIRLPLTTRFIETNFTINVDKMSGKFDVNNQNITGYLRPLSEREERLEKSIYKAGIRKLKDRRLFRTRTIL